jgi:very-short-patch-repair endonuclease
MRERSDKPQDERVWATRDRSIIAPNRNRATAMRATPTDAERKLWWHLRHRMKLPNSHFRRQVRFGSYIADFANHAARIVIEVDGSQHATRSAADSERTKFIEREGYRVLRFWNNDVLRNIDGVLEAIQSAITSTPTPNPSPQGGGEQA